MNTTCADRLSVPLVCAAILAFVLFPQLVFPASIKIMPLGDSITHGDGSTDLSGYRKELYDLLMGDGYAVDFVGSLANGPATFDNQHEGHGGWHADGEPSRSIRPAVNAFLTNNPADIVLLHIGTNDIGSGQDPAAIKDEIDGILDAVDAYEQSSGRDVWVILALIVNQAAGCAYRSQTTSMNNFLETMADARQLNGDKIEVVDMEIGAGLDYDIRPNGDMYDCIHPYATGYTKMADEWLQGLLNILPRARAGSDQNANPGVPVNLDGTGSSDSRLGTTNTYAWSQTSGSPSDVDITGADTLQASFTAPSVSGGTTLTFRLTITDDKNFSHSDTCNIIVNGPPVADAGADQQASAGAVVVLDGTRSNDAGGSIAAYRWAQVGGVPAVELIGADTSRASFTAPDVSSGVVRLTFQLTVTDNLGLQNTDSAVVEIHGHPIANAGPDQEIESGSTVILNGSGSASAENGVLSYAWVQTSGTPVALSSSVAVKPVFSAPSGIKTDITLTFLLTVTDSGGLQSTDSCTVTVFPEDSSSGSGGGGGGGGCFITTAGDRRAKGSAREKF